MDHVANPSPTSSTRALRGRLIPDNKDNDHTHRQKKNYSEDYEEPRP